MAELFPTSDPNGRRALTATFLSAATHREVHLGREGKKGDHCALEARGLLPVLSPFDRPHSALPEARSNQIRSFRSLHQHRRNRSNRVSTATKKLSIHFIRNSIGV